LARENSGTPHEREQHSGQEHPGDHDQCRHLATTFHTHTCRSTRRSGFRARPPDPDAAPRKRHLWTFPTVPGKGLRMSSSHRVGTRPSGHTDRRGEEYCVGEMSPWHWLIVIAIAVLLF